MAAQKVLNVGTKVRNFSLTDQQQNIFELAGYKRSDFVYTKERLLEKKDQ